MVEDGGVWGDGFDGCLAKPIVISNLYIYRSLLRKGNLNCLG